MKKLIMVLSLISLIFAQTSIYDIQFTSSPGSGNDCYPSSYDGQTVTTSGTVTGIRSSGFYMQSEAGAWNGIYVYDSSINPSVGDALEIAAEVYEYYGLTELTTVSSFTINSTGNSVEYTDVSTGELANGCTETGEAWEGALVRLSNITVTELPDGYNQWYVDDGTGPCQIDDGMFQFTPTDGQHFDYIVGNVDYSYSEFGLHPRSAEDIIEDASAPIIATPVINPANPTSDDDVTISVDVTYDSGIASVVLDYTVSDGNNGQLSMTASGDTYSATIPSQAGWTAVNFTITATGANGTSGTSQAYSYSVIGTDVPNVFISEYAEGTSNNKYLEIFNGSGADVDMSLFSLSICSNGCDGGTTFDYPNNVSFEAGTIIADGDVFVISHGSADAAILAHSDQTFTYLSNGDDFMALTLAGATESTYTIIDAIGEMGDDPGNGWDVAGVENATKDHTLVRKASVVSGNTDWASSAGTNENDSEWIVYDQDTWDNLGNHSQNVNAPSVAVTLVTPEFITDASEIEVSAELTPIEGTIATANIMYGTEGSLLNETEMWQESGDTWMGVIPEQEGNSILEFKIIATDNSGNSGESVTLQQLIASSSMTDISTIHDEISELEGEIVTIQGVITIGSGLLSTSWTSAYIQDESGRGLNLYSPSLIEGLNRGNELRMVGFVDKYDATVELVDFEYLTVSTGIPIPAPVEITTSNANSSNWEGTLITITGSVTAIDSVGDDGAKLSIDDGSGPTLVLIWNSTGLNGFDYPVGSEMGFTGVGSYHSYYEDYQTLVAYEEDVISLGVDDNTLIAGRFGLSPAFPNPFNPRTQLTWNVNIRGDYELSVYNLVGQKVEIIQNSMVEAGQYSTYWDAQHLSSGVYFVRLVGNGHTDVQKVILLK